MRKMAAGDLKGWPKDEARTTLVPQDVSSTDPLFHEGSTPLECALKSTVPLDEDHPERDELKRKELAIAKLKKMGFGEKLRSQAFSTLSQGWKQRLAVVCAILSEPDVLLLDEPSDAVDLPGIVRLEKFLLEESEDRILVVISHDTSFLNNITTDILYIDNKKLKVFPGDYASYVERQEERMRAMEARVDAAERQRDAAESFVKKQQHSSDVNKQKQAKEKREKMELLGAYREDGRRYKRYSLKKLDEKWLRQPEVPPERIRKAKELHFHLPSEFETLRISHDAALVRYDQVDVGYGKDSIILKKVTLQISYNSRIALVGENSSGKSTLMNALCKTGNVQVMGGTVSFYPSLQVAYIPQRYGESLSTEHGTITPAELCVHLKLFSNEQDSRQHLGRFGLTGKLGVTKISQLSGGQKTRLAIALKCAITNPHLLILDEPSHGLDAPARLALEEALQEFPGAVLVSSHDREFLREGGFNQLWITGKGALRCIAARPEEDPELQKEAFNDIFDAYLDSL